MIYNKELALANCFTSPTLNSVPGCHLPVHKSHKSKWSLSAVGVAGGGWGSCGFCMACLQLIKIVMLPFFQSFLCLMRLLFIISTDLFEFKSSMNFNSTHQSQIIVYFSRCFIYNFVVFISCVFGGKQLLLTANKWETG